MSFALRYYQDDAKRAAEAVLATYQSAAVVLPTGTGKSALAAAIARDWPTGRVLFLAHTVELIDQNAAEVAGFIGQQPCIEQADREALLPMWGGSRVVCASVSTLYQQARLTREVYADPSAFGLVIVDECHHAVKKNKKYRNIIDHFGHAKLLGLTATADRTDKAGLSYFKHLAYELRLSTAINEGYLVPIRQRYGVCKSIDFSRVRVVAGEFVEADLERVMVEEKALHEVAGAIMEMCLSGPTLVFAAGIHHAERLTEILRERHHVPAACVHGGNADYKCPKEWRKRRIEEFANGVHRILVGCDVFYEGFNVPSIANVVIAKKTKSRLRYTQAVGRGTRCLRSLRLPTEQHAIDERRAMIAASDKPYMTVIDLVGASTQLELELPCVADLLLDNPNADARARMKKNAIDKGEGGRDAQADLDEATEQLAREAEEKKRRAAVVANTHFEWANTGGIGTGERRTSAPVASNDLGGGRMATQPMIDLLRRNGVDATGMTKSEASREIAKIKDRRGELPITDAQGNTLHKAKVSAHNREHASALIGLLIARKWRGRQLPTARDDWGIDPLPDGKFRAQIVDGNVLQYVGDPYRTVDDCRKFIRRMIDCEQKLSREPEAAVA